LWYRDRLMPLLGVGYFFYGLVGVVRLFRKTKQQDVFDEMEQRVMLESSVFAYRISITVLMSAASLPALFPSLSNNPFYRNVWIVLPISQQVGFWIAQRRYR